jgi:phosphohistidine phosphatase SixA
MTKHATPLIASPSRRQSLVWLAAGTLGTAPGLLGAADVAERIGQGSCAVLIRHAQTVSGIGDPPNFNLAVCSTQRNLSEAGRNQSRDIGNWFKTKGLQPRAVLSSAWCRCIDTANLAFGRHALWTPLNSTFGDRLQQPDQTAQLREGLGKIPAGQFEVWVTHQVNMTSLTGEYPSMGEGFLVDRLGKLVGRTAFA